MKSAVIRTAPRFTQDSSIGHTEETGTVGDPNGLARLAHSPSLLWWMIVPPSGEDKIVVPIRRLGVDTGIWGDGIPMSVVATGSTQSNGCVGVIAPWSLE